ncbi:MAG: hypothetical protein WBN66_02650 [Smithella sp.]
MDRRKLTVPVSPDESISAILTMPSRKAKRFGAGVISSLPANQWAEGWLPRWLLKKNCR